MAAGKRNSTEDLDRPDQLSGKVMTSSKLNLEIMGCDYIFGKTDEKCPIPKNELLTAFCG